MSLNPKFLSFLFLIVYSQFFSQEKSDKKFRIQSINFQTVFTDNVGYQELSKTKDLDLKTYLLTSPLSSTLLPGQFTVHVKPQYSINFEFQIKSSKKSKSSLRIGLNNFSEVISAKGYNSQVSHVYDTIIAGNNEPYYLDSITIKNSDLTYSSQQIRLNTSYIFRINSEKRWSYYAGFGFSAGISYKSTTNINSVTSFGAIPGFGTDNYQYSNIINSSDNIVNKPNFGFIISSPVGLDFRIGKTNKLLSKIHLFYELKPSYNFITLSRMGSITNLNIQHGVGVRYVLR